MQGFILVSPRSWAMVFPFGLPKPEADPSDHPCAMLRGCARFNSGAYDLLA